MLERDAFFAFKRHNIQPNAIQWYLLFSLSPLSPVLHAGWGRLPPPQHIERRQRRLRKSTTSSVAGDAASTTIARSRHNSMASSVSLGSEAPVPLSKQQQQRPSSQIRTTFSTYIINPIPINEILLMRVKEGYRAKQYGQATSEDDRVSVQFFLDLDLGTTIHYELSYKALPDQDARLVGFAHIKIELSGDAVFIWSVKNDFLHPQGGRGSRPVMTMAQQVSVRLCTHLRWIRKEDMLQSYLSPLKWSDQLSSSDTPFVRRLGSLSGHQRRRHFCLHEFDCVLTGRMPWDEDDFLSEFRDTDDGELQLIEAVASWSTQTIKEGRRYVRRTHSTHGVAGYCVIELKRSPVASRVFTVAFETFGGMNASSRIALMNSLRATLHALSSVEVLPKQLGKFLVGEITRQHVAPSRRFYQGVLESQHNHATWDLVKDPELLPLLMKRRKEIGRYLLLDSNIDRALFARLFSEGTVGVGAEDRKEEESVISGAEPKDPGNLAQYQLAVLEDKVVVDLYMECEGGTFFPLRQVRSGRQVTQFHLLVRSLKTRDQECGHALRCRTTLLRTLDESKRLSGDEGPAADSHLSCVQRLLPYASKASFPLRFFHSGSGAANSILQSLTNEMLLSQSFGARVAKLPIDPGAVIEGLEPGDWFIVEFDRETSSIMHLSQHNKSAVSPVDGRGSTYRELTFFTIGITDVSWNRVEPDWVGSNFDYTFDAVD